MPDYLFCYGSLICKESRDGTGQTGRALPVVVEGLQRSWNAVIDDPHYRMTAVGAMPEEGARCNGILVEVAAAELPKFDAREKGYPRTPIDREKIHPLLDFGVPSGNIFFYPINNPGTPTQENPIPQTYVDVILTGCLGVSEEFTRDFICSTNGWDSPWVNDRKKPRYPGTRITAPTDTIDALLRELVPAFAKRVNVA